MALTKHEIINKVNEIGFTKKKSTEVIESLLETIKDSLSNGKDVLVSSKDSPLDKESLIVSSKDSLSNGEDVLVSGFGKFCIKEKRSRRGRNPATGQDLMLRERKVVTFKCSGKLRDKINDSQG